MIELCAGDLTLGLVPAMGGSVAYFRSGTLDLMRPLSTESHRRGDVFGVAMFPMVPYANRIANNEFTFDGRLWRFTANNPPERLNLHGTGWQSAWVIKEWESASATLVLDHLASEEPYSYRAVQRFVLTEERLVVTMTLTNRGAQVYAIWIRPAPVVRSRPRCRDYLPCCEILDGGARGRPHGSDQYPSRARLFHCSPPARYLAQQRLQRLVRHRGNSFPLAAVRDEDRGTADLRSSHALCRPSIALFLP